MKLKYVLYMAAALSLTGCNDSFLERGPQNLNDQSCQCLLWSDTGRSQCSG